MATCASRPSTDALDPLVASSISLDALPWLPMIIETHDLRRVFGSRAGNVIAVDGVDLSVEEGEIFGFLGPNGAGKTTTLRMLSTLLPPTSGSATIAGVDLLSDPAIVRQRIGYVGQAGGADPDLTARRELLLQGRLYGMGRGEAKGRSQEIIESLELTECADRRVKTYSGGQKRRLDIGIGLMHRPKVLFLDEPTTGLDPQSRAHMWEEVKKLREAGTTVFLTTHYLDEADSLCDRISIIDHGKIQSTGTPDELKRKVSGDVVTVGLAEANAVSAAAFEELRHESYVRDLSVSGNTMRLHVESGERDMPKILRFVDAHSIPIDQLSLHRPSLDDVFLDQTGRSLREANG